VAAILFPPRGNPGTAGSDATATLLPRILIAKYVPTLRRDLAAKGIFSNYESVLASMQK